MKLLKQFCCCVLLCGVVGMPSIAVADNDDDGQGRGRSAESIVTCGFGALPGVIDVPLGGLYTVLARSVPTSVDVAECAFGESAQSPCHSCITSLENQGCKVVDRVTEHFAVLPSSSAAMTTYMLSCVQP